MLITRANHVGLPSDGRRNNQIIIWVFRHDSQFWLKRHDQRIRVEFQDVLFNRCVI